MRSKAFFLTMDALIAAIIIGIGAILVVQSDAGVQSVTSYSYEKAHYLAEDAMTILSLTKLKDLNSSVINYLLSNTNLTQEDLEKKVLECLTILWAYNESEFARYLASVVLDPILQSSEYNYSLYIQDSLGHRHLIYGSDTPSTAKFVVASSRVLSGYKENALPRGYMARAFLRNLERNETLVVPIEPEGGAEGLDSALTISKLFRLNASKVYNATVHLALHMDEINWGTSRAYFNGVDVTSRIKEVKRRTDSSGVAWYGTIDITDILNQSIANGDVWHNFTFKVIGTGKYNLHVHPGSRIEVTYRSAELKEISEVVEERRYLDSVISEPDRWGSGSGVWVFVPINLPKDAEIINATLYLRVYNVTDTGYWWFWWWVDRVDVIVYFDDQVIYQDSSPSSNPYELRIDLTSYIESTNTTHIVLAEFNCREESDSYYGDRPIKLYSNPELDPLNSSYLYLKYRYSPLSKYKFGYVMASGTLPLKNPVDEEFAWLRWIDVNFTNINLYSSYVHPVEFYSTTFTATVDEVDVFESPTTRAVPSSIYIDPSYYSKTTTSRLEVREENSWNDYIHNSTILSFEFFIPSQVPYGEVFDTQEEAVEDARSRLLDLLSPYCGKYINCSPSNIANSSQNLPIANIPSMYGPVIAKLEVWR